MRAPLLSSLLLLSSACGSAEAPLPIEPCPGLQLAVLDSAVTPPSNVAAIVRVSDCDGAPLGSRLEAGAFSLAEDGAPLSAFEAERSVTALHRPQAQPTLITLDLSGSIVRSGLRAVMIEGARRLVESLRPTHAIALAGFDGRAELIALADFTSDADLLGAALSRAEQAPLVDDSTNLNGAVLASLALLDRQVEGLSQDRITVAQGALVLFTDGRDLAGRVSAQAVDDALERTAHATFALGVGPDVDGERLAVLGRTAAVQALDGAELLSAFEAIGAAVEARASQDYLLSYCSPARAGRRTVELRADAGERWGRTSLSFEADGFGAGCVPEATPLRSGL